jgi:hypothetical protein
MAGLSRRLAPSRDQTRMPFSRNLAPPFCQSPGLRDWLMTVTCPLGDADSRKPPLYSCEQSGTETDAGLFSFEHYVLGKTRHHTNSMPMPTPDLVSALGAEE